MKNPLVSIVVPMYNSARYLDRCIQSLVNQTLKDIEIILVNDASPDNSLEIARRYELQDNRIVVIDSPVNIVASRNLGIKAAKGEYLGFVDADDWVDEGFYELLYKGTNHGTIDVVYGRIRDVYESGRSTGETIIPSLLCLSQQSVKSYVTVNGGRLFSNIWRRSIVSDDVLFLEHNFYCDSIVFAWYLKAQTFNQAEGTSSYNYYINDCSITHTMNSPRFFDRLSASIDMFERCKSMGLYKKYKEEIDYRFYLKYFSNTLLVLCSRFDILPVSKVKEMKRYIVNHFDIKQNRYYKQQSKSLTNIVAACVLNSTSCGILLLYFLSIAAKMKHLVKKH